MASASAISNEEKAQVTAKLWILEYSCRRICRSFVNYKVDGSEDQEINSFYTIMSEMTSLLPSDENLDNVHKTLILMSEMCLRLLKKDFEFSDDDNFHSINDFVTYLSHQFNIKPEKKIQLQEFFNAQRVLLLHSAGLYKEAKCMFAKLKGEMFFDRAIKYIIQSSCAANISRNMSYENYLDSMQKFVGFLLDQISPGVLEKTATMYQSIGVETRLDHAEMMSLFRHHMEQVEQETQNDVDLNIPEGPHTETSSSAAEEVPSGKPKKYRKLFSHSRVHIDRRNTSTSVSEGSKGRNQLLSDEASDTSAWLSTKKRNITECSASATRPGDEETEQLPAKSYKQARNVNNRELAVLLNSDVEAAGDIIAAVSAAAEASAEDADADDAGGHADADDGAEVADAGNAEYADMDVDSDANVSVGNQDEAVDEDDDYLDGDYSTGEEVLRDVFGRLPRPGGGFYPMIPRVGVRPLRVPDNIARPVSPRVRRSNRARPLRLPEEDEDRDADPVEPEVPPLSPRMHRRDRARLVQENEDRDAEPMVPEFHQLPPLSPRMRRRDRARLGQDANDGADNQAADAGARAHGRLQRPSHSRRSRHNDSLPEVSSSDDQRPRRSLRYYDDDDSSPDGDDVSTSNTGTRRRKFTAEEEDFLRRGVRRFGVGRWAQILDRYDFNGRTSVNLKDKWRNMMRRDQEDEDAQEYL